MRCLLIGKSVWAYGAAFQLIALLNIDSAELIEFNERHVSTITQKVFISHDLLGGGVGWFTEHHLTKKKSNKKCLSLMIY